MTKTINEVGTRIVDDASEPGATPWQSVGRSGILSCQAWAGDWNGATVQIQLSHDRIHAVDVDGALLSAGNEGLVGLPGGVYYRGVITGNPTDLVVSVTPISQ